MPEWPDENNGPSGHAWIVFNSVQSQTQGFPRLALGNLFLGAAEFPEVICRATSLLVIPIPLLLSKTILRAESFARTARDLGLSRLRGCHALPQFSGNSQNQAFYPFVVGPKPASCTQHDRCDESVESPHKPIFPESAHRRTSSSIEIEK